MCMHEYGGLWVLQITQTLSLFFAAMVHIKTNSFQEKHMNRRFGYHHENLLHSEAHYNAFDELQPTDLYHP